MDEIMELTKINFSYVFISIFVILFAAKAGFTLLEWVIQKLGIETKFSRQKRIDHKLLTETSEGLTQLQTEYKHMYEEHEKSVDASIRHDKAIEKNLLKVSETVDEMSKQLDQMNGVITATATASRESLGDRISQKYRYYVQLDGIPEDELAEFISLHDAYKGVGGNHTGDIKYEYCINNLQILPPSKGINQKK